MSFLSLSIIRRRWVKRCWPSPPVLNRARVPFCPGDSCALPARCFCIYPETATCANSYWSATLPTGSVPCPTSRYRKGDLVRYHAGVAVMMCDLFPGQKKGETIQEISGAQVLCGIVGFSYLFFVAILHPAAILCISSSVVVGGWLIHKMMIDGCWSSQRNEGHIFISVGRWMSPFHSDGRERGKRKVQATMVKYLCQGYIRTKRRRRRTVWYNTEASTPGRYQSGTGHFFGCCPENKRIKMISNCAIAREIKQKKNVQSVNRND